MSLDSLIDREYVPWKPDFLGLNKSRILVPKGYEESGILKKAGKMIAPLVLAASMIGCNGEQVNPPPPPPPPVCEINPAVELAHEYGLPDSIVEAVRPLGNDCIVDEHEHNLITTLLPGILVRSNETIALSYPIRFIGDDGRFDPVEDTVMSRFFLGRYDREGLLVHPGYFELVDNGHVMIPNAYFIPIFEMPFRFDPFPGVYNGSKGLPIVDDNRYLSGIGVFDRSMREEGLSWLELSKEMISPDIVGCSTDGNFASMQIVFNNNAYDFSIDKLEVVNPLPITARVVELGFLVNANDVRNAWIRLKPEYWSSSLGHTGLQVSMSHLDDVDIEASGLRVGDVIPVDGRVGRLSPKFNEWRLIFSYRSDDGFYREGDANKDSRFKVIDVFDPQPHNPSGRGLVWPVYYESIRSDGVPEIMNLGVHTGTCVFNIDGTDYFGSHPVVPPMKYYFPVDTMVK
jgi:hypothetical protein